jgi:hypothetical protein
MSSESLRFGSQLRCAAEENEVCAFPQHSKDVTNEMVPNDL